MKPIPDHLRENLDLIFVGYNPSIRSSQVGHHYANPNNRFWRILHKAGITPRLYEPHEDRQLLELGFGMTNIVARPTKAADEIRKEEYRKGSEELKKKVETYRPKIVCFVGKGVYQQYSGKKKLPWGRQEHSVVPGTIDFIAPSSSGLVRMKMDEVVSIYEEIPALLKQI